MKRGWMCVVLLAAVGCGSSKSAEKKDAPPKETAAAPAEKKPAEPPPPKPCDLWKQDCADGEGCMMASGAAVCVPISGGAEAAKCEASNDCGRGLVCTSDGCRKLCDDTHACAAGNNCNKFDNQGNLGACVPAPPPPAAAPAPAPAAEPKKGKKKK